MGKIVILVKTPDVHPYELKTKDHENAIITDINIVNDNKFWMKLVPNDDAKRLALTNPKFAYIYSKYVLNQRFPDGESVIAEDAHWSTNYAINVLKDRFITGEAAINADEYWSVFYKENIKIVIKEQQEKK